MADAMRLGTPEVQCGDEAVHGEHEWLILGAFNSWCPGYVGAVVVPSAPIRVRHDPGALMEEPDLYEPVIQAEDDAHMRAMEAQMEHEAEQPEDGTR